MNDLKMIEVFTCNNLYKLIHGHVFLFMPISNNHLLKYIFNLFI